jgi:hypothetical protein
MSAREGPPPVGVAAKSPPISNSRICSSVTGDGALLNTNSCVSRPAFVTFQTKSPAGTVSGSWKSYSIIVAS